MVTSQSRRTSKYFRGKTPADFGVNVYRKSTGDLALRTSAAKDVRSILVISKVKAPSTNTLYNAAVLSSPEDRIDTC
jgi:hypothetical protein